MVLARFEVKIAAARDGKSSLTAYGRRPMAVSEATGGRGAAGKQRLSFIIGASSVGTLIEWYDFYIYGVLAAVFAQHFFPPGNDALAFLGSLAIFWFGFIARPFGAIFFGHLGDLIGRKFTFMVTLGLMGSATFL